MESGSCSEIPVIPKCSDSGTGGGGVGRSHRGDRAWWRFFLHWRACCQGSRTVAHPQAGQGLSGPALHLISSFHTQKRSPAAIGWAEGQ